MDWSVEESKKLYRIEAWGDGHFDVGENGDMLVRPNLKRPELTISIADVLEEMKSEGVGLPCVIRFHDILRAQVRKLNQIFRKNIDEYNYEGRFYGVYPVKVNQMREVVEEVVEAGSKFDYGLEAGSKAELLSVLAYNENKNSLSILNGYKDEDYMRLALLGRKIGRKMIVVIEKYSEIALLIKLSKEMNVSPLIGIRAKMTVKGRGKWSCSSGDKAKFGLSIPEIIKAIELITKEGLIDCVKLLHFHIGSQITDIRAVKEAITEGARIYAKLCQMGVPLEYFDVGGGLGVDYDGSRSTSDSSKNYSTNEYVSDIVYGLKEVCDLEDVAHPNIVTESGRAITAHHSLVVTNILGKIKPSETDFNTKRVTGEHILVTNMRGLLDELVAGMGVQEVFNDCAMYKEDSLNAFKLGVISLEERAKIETLYWNILTLIQEKMRESGSVPEELADLDETLASQYLCNFSVFQSAADSWAIDQLLPIVPIARLNEYPSVQCTIADITCDSDGRIDRFIGADGPRTTLPIHEVGANEQYVVGLFLTGAYQDVMGDMHNLFGRLNEVHVYAHDEEEKHFYIEEIIFGNSAETVLGTMQYNPQFMAQTVKKQLDREVERGQIRPRDGVHLADFYERCLGSYTYLN